MERKFLQFIKLMKNLKRRSCSLFENKLFFHSLTSSQVPKDSSLVWFEDVKQCLNSKDFCTFIKICCNEKNLCTGECGPSYKGSFFEKGYNKRIKSSFNSTNVLHFEKRIENEIEKMRLRDYQRCLPKQESTSMVASIYFDLLNTFNATWKPPFGRVISPLTLYKDINYNNPSNLVLDCGILINL
ncbi:hypothetical protein Avbf_13571, partial [Armadillidium vulgare]